MAAGNGWIDAEHLLLSSLGCDASLSYTSQTTFEQIIENQIKAADPTQTPVELSTWKHRIVVGRDFLFIEATPGFLFPFVFPCFFVRLTQRRFASYADTKTNRRSNETGFSAPGA